MTTWEVREGDCREVMAALDPESVDAIVCDPPYGLSFMGKGWDHGVPGVEFWEAALRVAKPGAHLLAFGGTRTFHRLTCAIEDAGWEVRDCLSWMYGTGFPKSRNLDGEWRGWGTALKLAWEPIILARKPLAGTVAANVLRHGTGAVNVDGCRIGTADSYSYPNGPGGNVNPTSLGARKDGTSSLRRETPVESNPLGRWPANVLLDEAAADALDEQAGMEASRFLYTAKASRGEREAGLREAGLREAVVGTLAGGGEGASDPVSERFTKTARNVHPTVKPIAVMRWLARLVTPPGGLILDPFNGSGTTGCAAVLEGFRYLGIEREPEYVEIARARIAHWAAQDPTPLLRKRAA